MRVLGHRGASAVAPENSLEAFRIALGMGADGVELDVRRTVDGALVLHHDAVTAGGSVIGASTLAHLRAEVADLPVLEDALDTCRDAEVNVEIKNIPSEPGFDPDCRVSAAVVELLRSRGSADQVIVSSFHIGTIDAVKAHDENVPTGLLTFLTPNAVDGARLARARGHDAVHPHHGSVDRDLVARAHGDGLLVNTWTVDEPGRIAELAAIGVDAVVTNVPDVALRALERG